MATFMTKTLGCRVNLSETDLVTEQLISDGHVEARQGERTDFVIINTCTVTQKAAMQSRQLIRQARRTHPEAKLLVTGCYAQTAPQEIERINGVHAIIGNRSKHQIPEMITADLGFPATDVGPVTGKWQFEDLPVAGRGTRSRPILKVQDGCQAYCSYCIVPFARGPSRSLPPAAVLKKIVRLHQAGYQEVVLSGIHLGAYGLDLSPKCTLLDLLKKIRQTQSITRVRLSSIEPRELTDPLIDWIAAPYHGPGRICPHFHVPLQSGDDLILKKMRRPYTRSDFKSRILKIYEQMPEAAIGVDVLVGFPGESAAAFDHTLSLLAELPVAYLHVFPFSPRKGTPAFRFPDRIDPDTIKERSHRLRRLSNQKRITFYRRFQHHNLEVVLETRVDASRRLLKGTSANYIPVIVAGDPRQLGALHSVTVRRINGIDAVTGTINSPA